MWTKNRFIFLILHFIHWRDFQVDSTEIYLRMCKHHTVSTICVSNLFGIFKLEKILFLGEQTLNFFVNQKSKFESPNLGPKKSNSKSKLKGLWLTIESISFSLSSLWAWHNCLILVFLSWAMQENLSSLNVVRPRCWNKRETQWQWSSSGCYWQCFQCYTAYMYIPTTHYLLGRIFMVDWKNNNLVIAN